MEVKIGVQHSPREVVLESSASASEVTEAVTTALAGGVLTLTDEKGRVVFVPGDRIAYVEIAASQDRRVGFAG